MSDISISENCCQVCNLPAERKCSACKLAFYCGQEHQKEHWKEHKPLCKPYEICCSSHLGKYLQATRDLEDGDLIFAEYPLVFGPKPHLIMNGPFPCVGCCRLLHENSCTQCQGCSWPACSSNCPGLTDPTKHGLECGILKLRQPNTENQSFYEYFRFDVLIILRVLFLQKTNKVKWNQLLSLEDHLDKRGPGTDVFKTVEEKIKHIETNYLQPLKIFEKESGQTILPVVNSDIIHRIYGILDVNATELTEDIDAEILYPTASLVEHDCIPNVRQIIAGDEDKYRITFRTALPIKKGEHIKSMYTHILWGTYARRKHLLKTKYFSCICNRCKDPTELGTLLSALKCMGTEKSPCGGTQLPVNPIDPGTKWICSKCKITLPNCEIMKFVDHLGLEVEKVQSKHASLQDLEDILHKLLIFLHPNHYHIYAIKHTLVQMYCQKEDTSKISDKLKMCENLIEITKKLDPGNTRLSIYLAVLLNELHLAKFSLLKKNIESNGTVDNNELIRSINKILEESQRVLKYELCSISGSKLNEVICQNETNFRSWIKEHILDATEV